MEKLLGGGNIRNNMFGIGQINLNMNSVRKNVIFFPMKTPTKKTDLSNTTIIWCFDLQRHNFYVRLPTYDTYVLHKINNII